MPEEADDPEDLQSAMAQARRLQERLGRLQQRQLAAHRAGRRRSRRRLAGAIAVLLAGTGVAFAIRTAGGGATSGELAGATGTPSPGTSAEAAPAGTSGCTPLRVLTASAFAPVVRTVAAVLAAGSPCVRVRVEVADGRAAAARLPTADAWVPDDLAWQALVPPETFAQKGSVLATSPVYLVAGRTAADRIRAAGPSWTQLARLGARPDGVSIVVRDPKGSATGLVGAGAVGEAVWVRSGMDASALALAEVFERARTVRGSGPAMPRAATEVALVPEYALPADSGRRFTVLAPRDRAAALRVGWLPTARGARDRDTARGVELLEAALRGDAGTAAIRRAGFRPAGSSAPASRRWPAVPASSFGVLEPHHVEHVFATWYRADRRANLLIVVDVSGSMVHPPPGGDRALIVTVREACRTVGRLLPDNARLGLWEFGSQLDGARDHRVLLPAAALTRERRRALDDALGRMVARRTNTGLYDTILAAYRANARTALPGVRNQVLVFTDGRNEGDPDSISAGTLRRKLAAAARTQPETALSVLAFGSAADARSVSAAIRSVDGQVIRARTGDDVRAAFMHLVSGGLHSDEG